MDATFQLIKQLTELPGISGHEGRVRDFMTERMAPLVDELEISPLGNVFGIRHSMWSDVPRIMVAAHMDEVGFLVKQVQENGTFSVVPVGGWNPYIVSAQRYQVLTDQGDIPVVSSSIPPHLLRGQKTPPVTIDALVFDGGFTSREEAERYGIRPGDPVVPDVTTIRATQPDHVMGKAWDNRYGCAVIIETLERLVSQDLDCELIIGASVQEEVGLRGIKSAIQTYQPDVFIAVDCSPAGDAFGDTKADGQLGEGFLLRIHDPGMITHPGWVRELRQLAEAESIPYQTFFSKGGTDAGAAHTMNQGIPSAVIGVPARYIHGHQSLYNLKDYQAAREMLYQTIVHFNQSTYQRIINH